jgi:hypothetical protein
MRSRAAGVLEQVAAGLVLAAGKYFRVFRLSRVTFRPGRES